MSRRARQSGIFRTVLRNLLARSRAYAGSGLRDSSGRKRDADDKGRSLAKALALRMDASTVQFDNMADYCQSKAQPSVIRSPCLGLAKAIEHPRQKFAAYPYACVRNCDLGMCGSAVDLDLYLTTAGGEFDGIRE